AEKAGFFFRSLAYSICWGGFSFTKACFTIVIHPSQFHKHFNLFITQNIRCTSVLLFVNPKHYIVDWNERRRLLGLGLRTARPTEDICGNSMSLETPQ